MNQFNFRISHSIRSVIAFAVITFWRGLWGLMNIYLFPNNYELSLWITLIGGLLILIITNHSIK
ncbi:hypothetical protein COU62_00770 [Candidatus Pacearchaeota archaeon CG10_big_fil_rev_8_21_14_0_10_35_219]|nr:hypothetical protein [Candidatus Pacearchaeota archaeon]PIO08218.1 MAG: hypothetical protein COU62_00770 [Candidatus Pacearchaeota archaeon CG10_big_fil_rev_8_21_14_0_10_35_219]PIY81728.1 MAG: hypothetical protein COY79_01065 [Candidatus Pacearchaeota archaeon CG_4_10_14_0_8_um_filter_35_169]PIZ80368.1 MAG: hypothetical protein COY00_01430 [Candidatus Pacearchaeota archaeon CG_4_10_14_0_2_um_filter_35_33]PJA69944.1 MAG: hypothetical protein CO155_02550 [Candidatus Pacearchaeota archaeon CG_4